jgi:hypothetical protein
MTKAATEVMQDILIAATLEAIGALKAASKGLPNTLLRDLNAIHANTTFADLPPEVQASITASVRTAFTRLLREGYSISPNQPGAVRPAPQRRDAPSGAGHRPRGPQPPRRGSDGKPGGRGGRPDRKPRPPRG